MDIVLASSNHGKIKEFQEDQVEKESYTTTVSVPQVSGINYIITPKLLDLVQMALGNMR